MYHYDWSELAFKSKKDVSSLKAIFIMAPREMSGARFKQLLKDYLPEGNIVVGLAKEKYIEGFEGQPQFRTLEFAKIEKIIDLVNKSKIKNKVYSLSYFQREIDYILDKISFKKVLLINGSWKHVFHSLPTYYLLASKRIDYEMLSPFASDKEAFMYEAKVMPPEVTPKGLHTEKEMLKLADDIATRSFEYPFQTGATLGLKKGDKYQFVAQSYNRVVPYQTYAMHYGSVREANFSPMHDLNHYDTVHAEVELIIRAQKKKLDLKDTSLFINLLTCPNCARMLCETDIKELVYRVDHSEGFAIKLLETAGKSVRRIVY